jgi:hypothetical protein
LKEVTITAQKQVVEFKPDKIQVSLNGKNGRYNGDVYAGFHYGTSPKVLGITRSALNGAVPD